MPKGFPKDKFPAMYSGDKPAKRARARGRRRRKKNGVDPTQFSFTYDEKKPKRIGHDEVWTTRDGRRIEVQDLDADHVRNILRMLLRAQRLRREEASLAIAGPLRAIDPRAAARLRAEFFDGADGVVDETGWDQ